jgi:hypothetical protein
MSYWLLIAYLLYSAGAVSWVGDRVPELSYRFLMALDALSAAILSLKHTVRAAAL